MYRIYAKRHRVNHINCGSYYEYLGLDKFPTLDKAKEELERLQKLPKDESFSDDYTAGYEIRVWNPEFQWYESLPEPPRNNIPY